MKSDGFYKSVYNVIYKVDNSSVYIYHDNGGWRITSGWVPEDFTKPYTVFTSVSEEELFVEML